MDSWCDPDKLVSFLVYSLGAASIAATISRNQTPIASSTPTARLTNISEGYSPALAQTQHTDEPYFVPIYSVLVNFCEPTALLTNICPYIFARSLGPAKLARSLARTGKGYCRSDKGYCRSERASERSQKDGNGCVAF